MRRRAKQSDRLALRSVLCAMTQPSTSFVRLNLRLTPVQMLWAPVRWFSGARASRDFHRSLTRLERDFALGLGFMLAAQGAGAPDLPDQALIACGARRRAAHKVADARGADAKPQPRPAIASRSTLNFANTVAARPLRTIRRQEVHARAALARLKSRHFSPPCGLPKRGRWRLA
jgi:hypothetical protein